MIIMIMIIIMIIIIIIFWLPVLYVRFCGRDLLEKISA